jgi:hypothetical protein
MFIDYKVKKYNFKIINAIKKNNIIKIPEYLHHISFYLKENLNNNNFIGGKPPKSSKQPNKSEKETNDLDSIKISSELDKSLFKIRSLKEHLINDISEKKRLEDERNLSHIKSIEYTKNNELCKIKEEYNKQITRNKFEIDKLNKENQSKLDIISELEQSFSLLKSNSSYENQKILEEIKQNKSVIEENKSIIDKNKIRIEKLEEENIEINKELLEVYEKLDKTQESRQSNYSAGLIAIKNFRILTLELSEFPGMDTTKLLDAFGFSNEKQLEEYWGLSGNAAKYVLGINNDVPNLGVINP